MRTSRLQIWLTVLLGVFLLGTVTMFGTLALAPNTTVVNRPILLTGFIVSLFLSMVCIAWLLRGLLRPYSQLVGEAKRAPVEHSAVLCVEAGGGAGEGGAHGRGQRRNAGWLQPLSRDGGESRGRPRVVAWAADAA